MVDQRTHTHTHTSWETVMTLKKGTEGRGTKVDKCEPESSNPVVHLSIANYIYVYVRRIGIEWNFKKMSSIMLFPPYHVLCNI
jgi:hypothetical protein